MQTDMRILEDLGLGKCALVTGAGSGIGREIAIQLAKRDVDLYLLDSNEEILKDIAKLIQSLGRKTECLVQDTSDSETIPNIQRLIQASELGSVEMLVNCAGISPKNDKSLKRMIWETESQEWKRVMDVNLNGYFHTIRALLPGMVGLKKGSIINISSLAGRRYTTIAGAAYAVSKGAVDALTRQTAGEVAHFGIRVNGIAPGRIETSMSAIAGESFNEKIRQATPVGRLGEPSDIAKAALFLLSDQAGFITGETLVVSGGRGI